MAHGPVHSMFFLCTVEPTTNAATTDTPSSGKNIYCCELGVKLIGNNTHVCYFHKSRSVAIWAYFNGIEMIGIIWNSKRLTLWKNTTGNVCVASEPVPVMQESIAIVASSHAKKRA